MGGWGTEERGVGTHANEGDELLIRVFIRAVRRDRRVLQRAGETAWRAGDGSFPRFTRFTEALREPRHHLPSSLCPQDGMGSLQKEARAPIVHALSSAPTSVPTGRHSGWGQARAGKKRHYSLGFPRGKCGEEEDGVEKQKN